MTTPSNRSLFGAIALLFAAASFDVSGAMAQSTLDTGDVISTICGPGTETQCGTESIIRCSFKFDVSANPLTKSGGLTFGLTDCKTVGTRTLYKNRHGTAGTCSVPIGSGRIPGGTSRRSGGDDEGFGDEACE